jgi:hypothetical protein
MGYDIHITRRAEWFDERAPAIALDEWLAVVRNDPELRLDGFAEAPLSDGSVLRVEDSSMAVWHAYSRHGYNNGAAWIWWNGGNIEAKNPDKEILRKMWLIAQRLSARVQGDECEFYDSAGEVIADSLADHAPPPTPRPWWRFW